MSNRPIPTLNAMVSATMAVLATKAVKRWRSPTSLPESDYCSLSTQEWCPPVGCTYRWVSARDRCPSQDWRTGVEITFMTPLPPSTAPSERCWPNTRSRWRSGADWCLDAMRPKPLRGPCIDYMYWRLSEGLENCRSDPRQCRRSHLNQELPTSVLQHVGQQRGV